MNDTSFSRICSSNDKRINWLKHKKSNERRNNSLEDTKQLKFIFKWKVTCWLYNNPFRIASNWEFVDEDGITNVVSGTEYLYKKKDK